MLELLGDGLRHDVIARRLFISPKTVATHVEHILRKLGVRSRAEAIAVAYREEILQPRVPLTGRMPSEAVAARSARPRPGPAADSRSPALGHEQRARREARQGAGRGRRDVAPPASSPAVAAAAAPVAPNGGISTRSSTMPSVSDTSGPTEDRPGADDATSAFEKIASATKPSAPGSEPQERPDRRVERAPEHQRDQRRAERRPPPRCRSSVSSATARNGPEHPRRALRGIGTRGERQDRRRRRARRIEQDLEPVDRRRVEAERGLRRDQRDQDLVHPLVERRRQRPDPRPRAERRPTRAAAAGPARPAPRRGRRRRSSTAALTVWNATQMTAAETTVSPAATAAMRDRRRRRAMPSTP